MKAVRLFEFVMLKILIVAFDLPFFCDLFFRISSEVGNASSSGFFFIQIIISLHKPASDFRTALIGVSGQCIRQEELARCLQMFHSLR
jgi:hypothetical protein